ncbi:hypothetical protein D3C87_2019190 [compost metagenome]
MESTAPVSSPIEIIWVTMGGKTAARSRGRAIPSPSRTAWRTSSTAPLTMALPDESRTISSADRRGTPDLRRVPKVRVKRATAIF